eukprot:scaffold101093_cov27-Attheya_sp.AAC.2
MAWFLHCWARTCTYIGVDDIEVGDGDSSEHVVGVFLNAACKYFGANFRLLLLGLVDHMVDLGGVLARPIGIVFGVVLGGPEHC